MYLSELKKGDIITLKASHGCDCIEFQSSIIGSINMLVFMEPVISVNKPVNFISDFVHTDILYEQDGGGIYLFKNVHIVNERDLKGKLVSYLHCVQEGELLNRREAKRFVVNEVGVFSPGPHRAAVSALIRDISVDGICLVSSLSATVGSIGRFSFIPERVQGIGNISEEVEIRRVINDSDTNRVVCGCKFTKQNSLINRYISEYQRQLLKNKANPS